MVFPSKLFAFSVLEKSSTTTMLLNPSLFNLLTKQLPIKPAAPVTTIILFLDIRF